MTVSGFSISNGITILALIGFIGLGVSKINIVEDKVVQLFPSFENYMILVNAEIHIFLIHVYVFEVITLMVISNLKTRLQMEILRENFIMNFLNSQMATTRYRYFKKIGTNNVKI